MNYSVTLNQKRFLIVWICIHSIALFVNIFKIDGELKNRLYSPIFNIFNTYRQYNNRSDFWPFVAFTSNGKVLLTENPNDDVWIWKDWAKDDFSFFGVFNSYDLPEYIFYMLLGLGIIFIPKLWHGSKI